MADRAGRAARGCDWSSAGSEARCSSLAGRRYAQHRRADSRHGPPIPRSPGPSGGGHRIAAPGHGRPGRGLPRRGTRGRSTPCASSDGPPGRPKIAALAHAPVLYPRPNTLGRFTDVPLVMWYETDTTPRGTPHPLLGHLQQRGRRHAARPADGDLGPRSPTSSTSTASSSTREGRVLRGDTRARTTRSCRSRAPHGPRIPLLWVVTDNNMVSDERRDDARASRRRPSRSICPATSREAVMDANPWTYAVSAQEARREGRVRQEARAGLEAASPTRAASSTSRPARRRRTPPSTFGVGRATGQRRAALVRSERRPAGLSDHPPGERVPERLLPRRGRAARRTRTAPTPRASASAPSRDARARTSRRSRRARPARPSCSA